MALTHHCLTQDAPQDFRELTQPRPVLPANSRCRSSSAQGPCRAGAPSPNLAQLAQTAANFFRHLPNHHHRLRLQPRYWPPESPRAQHHINLRGSTTRKYPHRHHIHPSQSCRLSGTLLADKSPRRRTRSLRTPRRNPPRSPDRPSSLRPSTHPKDKASRPSSRAPASPIPLNYTLCPVSTRTLSNTSPSKTPPSPMSQAASPSFLRAASQMISATALASHISPPSASEVLGACRRV